MLEHVGERLLHDAVGGQVDAGGHRAALALDGQARPAPPPRSPGRPARRAARARAPAPAPSAVQPRGFGRGATSSRRRISFRLSRLVSLIVCEDALGLVGPAVDDVGARHRTARPRRSWRGPPRRAARGRCAGARRPRPGAPTRPARAPSRPPAARAARRRRRAPSCRSPHTAARTNTASVPTSVPLSSTVSVAQKAIGDDDDDGSGEADHDPAVADRRHRVHRQGDGEGKPAVRVAEDVQGQGRTGHDDEHGQRPAAAEGQRARGQHDQDGAQEVGLGAGVGRPFGGEERAEGEHREPDGDEGVDDGRVAEDANALSSAPQRPCAHVPRVRLGGGGGVSPGSDPRGDAGVREFEPWSRFRSHKHQARHQLNTSATR